MKKDGFTSKRIEESARTHDVIGRAKAASPVTAGRDVLLGHGQGTRRMDTIGSVTDKL